MTRTGAATTPMVAFEGGQLLGALHRWPAQPVWVRVHGPATTSRSIVVHVGEPGPAEVARHARATPGSPQLDDEHFPPAPPGALVPGAQGHAPPPRPSSWPWVTGARLWLVEAAAAGATRMRVKMAAAVSRRQAHRAGRGRPGARARRGQRPLRRG